MRFVPVTATLAAAAAAVALPAAAVPPKTSNAGCVGASVSVQAQAGAVFGQQVASNAKTQQPFGAVVSAFAHRDRPECAA